MKGLKKWLLVLLASVGLSFVFAMLFSGCAEVPLDTPAPQSAYEISSKATQMPQMEFIGFKATADDIPTGVASMANADAIAYKENGKKITRTNISNYDCWKLFKKDNTLSRLGRTLENKNIAQDNSSIYNGSYSTQELSIYNTKNRYLTFVQVEKNDLSWYGKDGRYNWGVCAGISLAAGIPLTVAGACIPSSETDDNGVETDYTGAKLGCLVPGLICDFVGLIGLMGLGSASSNLVTTFQYDGSFDIIIYDTVAKQIVEKISDIRVQPKNLALHGFYQNDDMQKIVPYYATLINNAILKEYERLNTKYVMKQ